MNKRAFFILAMVAVLALPMGAMAATEFSLGGFIKLDAFWDSTQEGKNMNGVIARNNDPNFHHGRLKFTSQGSRFNLTIKGPKLWGATTTGFIEMDFDSSEQGLAAVSPSNAYTPRLRHAMFRMNWPETELLFGQYWSLFSQWFPETAQDGAFQMTGTPTARLAQIRLTQKFLGAWKVTGLVGESNAISNGQSYSANDRNGGESTETPQVQVQAEFAQDLWGKAAWYGKPTPFTAQITGGWQRSITQDTGRLLGNIGQNNFNAVVGFTRHEYENPWVVMGTLFVPVIPTHSANLAGTASLQTSWWVGQGVEAYGWTSFGSQVFRYSGRNAVSQLFYDVDLMHRFGGQVQGQYYFNNEWFLTAAWGMSKAFNVGASETSGQAALDLVPDGRKNAFAADTVNYHHEWNLCVWYRPITAFKFGLQYAYARTNFFQNIGQGTAPPAANQYNKTNIGEAHRVEFVGLFFF